MIVKQFKPEQLINTVTIGESFLTNDDERVVMQFNDDVKHFRNLLEKTNIVPIIGSSQGKDSSTVTLIVIEAFRQAIAEKTIEPNRPLIMTTVNTKGEAIAMNFYVHYARKRIIDYCKKHAINLRYDIVSPSLNNEFFVRYAGAQKLPATPGRNGDCSIILKLNPNQRFIKSIVNEFDNDERYREYRDSPLLMCLGSRSDESSRRKNNMLLQQLSNKSASDILNSLEKELIGKRELINFAPIANWSTDNVFLLLSLAGDKPIKRSPHSVPGYLEHFGLLQEIYGNGSANETCEIVSGKSGGSGCNGKARFGCSFCTVIGNKDKSSDGLASLARWKSLGVEDSLRVRDWLYRISSSMDCRALHARAFDSVGYNRIALQGNTLKPKYLEKMVRYASQLTQDAIKYANEFAALKAANKEMEHEGYREIAQSQTLSPRIKKAFLEMYSEAIVNPENLNYLFTQKHAILLSFRWSLDGVGSAPFKPLSVWNDISQGKGRIPYPKLNKEIPKSEHKKIEGYDALPEAVMMPVLKNEQPHEHVFNHTPLLSLWRRPVDVADVLDEEMNCTISRKSDHTAAVNVEFDLQVLHHAKSVNDLTGCTFNVEDSKISFALAKPIIKKVMFQGKVLTGKAKEQLLAGGLIEQVNEYAQSHFEANVERITHANINIPSELADYAIKQLSSCTGTFTINRDVKYLKETRSLAGYMATQRKEDPKLHFTQRVTKVKKGVLTRGNTRMVFYPFAMDSRLHSVSKQEASVLIPAYDSHTQKTISIHDSSLFDFEEEAKENILVCDKALSRWKAAGGVEKALALHDNYIQRLIKYRHVRQVNRFDIRRYAGTQAVEELLSSGVVSIERKYWAQFHAIYKRTQVLDSLGMFKYQSMPVEMVQNARNAITMAQHRKDKVAVLNQIRLYRNEQREAVKASKKNHISIEAPISQIEAAVKESLSITVHTYNASSLWLHFDTHEVALNERVNTAMFWLAYQFDDVKNVDHVLKKIVPSKILSSLRDNPVLKVKLTKRVAEHLISVSCQIEAALKLWKPIEQGMAHYLSHSYETREEAKAAFIQHIASAAPYEPSMHLMNSWNPSACNREKTIKKVNEKIHATRLLLESIAGQLKSAANTGTQKAVASLSLADKLALMNK